VRQYIESILCRQSQQGNRMNIKRDRGSGRRGWRCSRQKNGAPAPPFPVGSLPLCPLCPAHFRGQSAKLMPRRLGDAISGPMHATLGGVMSARSPAIVEQAQ